MDERAQLEELRKRLKEFGGAPGSKDLEEINRLMAQEIELENRLNEMEGRNQFYSDIRPYMEDLNEAMRGTIDMYRMGRATEKDVQRFVPSMSEWDIANTYGQTDTGGYKPAEIAPPSVQRLDDYIELEEPATRQRREGGFDEFPYAPGGPAELRRELRAKDGGSVDKNLAKEMSNNKFDQLFVESGQKYGVDPAVLKAIASVESSFRPNIRGPRTKYGQAQGMMQFIPATAKAYGLDDPMDPAKSIDAAARLMRDNIKMFKGDVGKALEAYNGGPRLVGKSKQTAEYRDRVMQRSQYANLGASPTRVAQKPAPTTPSRAATPSPPARVGGERVGLSALSTLPMNYQAALALQYITDTDPEGNPEEQAEQALLDLERSADYGEQEQGPSLAQALASQSEAQEPEAPMPSPFEPLRRASKRQRETEKRRPLPSMAAITGFSKGGEARSDDYEDLATQMTFGTLPEDAKDYKAMKEGLKESGRDIRRGIQFFPADLIGAPVDIANMALTPFGLGSDKPFMGSDYLIDKGVKAGIYEKPSGSGVETITRMAGLPTTALRSAMSAMQKGEEALTRGVDIARGKFPETAPEGIVRPFGGASSVARTDQDHASSVQYGLYYAMKDMQTLPFADKQAQDAAMRMFDVKARNWFNEQAGTANDPLKQKLYSGKITFTDPTNPMFPAHLLEAAKKGKGVVRESAQMDLEDRYDAMVGVKRLVPESMDMSLSNAQRDELFRQAAIADNQKILQQLRDNPDLIPDQYLLTVFKNKAPDKMSDAEHLKEVKAKLREAPEVFSARVEPFLRKLITSPAERVSLDKMINFKDKYSDVAREAASRGETFTYGGGDASGISARRFYHYSLGGPNFFGHSMRDYAQITPAIPTRELEKMSFPDFIERATALLKQKEEAKDIANVAKEMLSKDITRKMPPEIMLQGISKTPSVTSSPSGPIPPELGPIKSLGWHKLEDPYYATTIAATMKNSVGNYADYGTYGGAKGGRRALETGDAEVYVLYDDKLRPHMTAEIVREPGKNTYSVYQMTGNGPLTSNARASEYLKDASIDFRTWVQGRTAPVKKAGGGLVSMKSIHDWV